MERYFVELTTTNVIMKSNTFLYPLPSGPAIPSIPSWREDRDGVAIPSCTAIPDGQPWRDDTSRDLCPAEVLTLSYIPSGTRVKIDPSSQFLGEFTDASSAESRVSAELASEQYSKYMQLLSQMQKTRASSTNYFS